MTNAVLVAIPATGNYNQFWVVERDWRRSADVAHHRSAGRTPAADDARGAEAARRRELEHRKRHAFDAIREVFAGWPSAACTCGVPRLQAAYNSYFQIVQTPEPRDRS